VFIVKDDETIHHTTTFRESHFPVDQVFYKATYLRRFEILCSRLVTERLYDNVWYICLDAESGSYTEPNPDMTWSKFEAAITGKVREELA